MQRSCVRCGEKFEAQTSRRRYCGSTCRARAAETGIAQVPLPDPDGKTPVANALGDELEELEVAGTYEGQVALGIAKQLDNGTVVGAAYASLSKELDRRVDALRLKAERDDDPTRVIKGRLEAKRAQLA